MAEDTKSEFTLVDAIASEAYVSTMITCLLCERNLMAENLGIEEPNDPMEKWAEGFCTAAKKAGWSVSSSTGAIVCPKCHD
ncbi:hypothetical protein [Marinobacter sp. F3R11]|uniref:hypothetical protein n=1 Tax=Marinobacter sp. F3R11 TaxID=2267231 RepID=UPI0011E592EF|nr:hypothetical protein [Marinobacter sp. F3R11]